MRENGVRGAGKLIVVSGALVVGLLASSSARADNWTTTTGGQITSGTGTRVGVGGLGNVPSQLDVQANTASREGLVVNQVQASPAIARFRQNGTTRMLLTAPGNLGIGTTTPTEKLHVVGNVTVTGSVNADGGLRIKNTWTM